MSTVRATSNQVILNLLLPNHVPAEIIGLRQAARIEGSRQLIWALVGQKNAG
jgi:hypothetical protein